MKLDIDRPAPAPPRAASRPSEAALKAPERLAWLVIWGAFGVCVLLTVSLPLGARHFVLTTVDPRSGTVQAISPSGEGCGTVRVTPLNATQPTAVTCDPAPFAEGSAIETDQSSRGFISFFDGSTAQVFSSSRLVAVEMHQPRFQWSALPNTIQISQERGLVLYNVAPAVAHAGNPEGRSLVLQVQAADFFSTSLPEGSYSIEVNGKTAQIIVRQGGPALVSSTDGTREISVGQGQRAQVTQGEPLGEPIAAAQDLIQDGNFASDNPWAVWPPMYDQGGDGGATNGKLDLVTEDGRRALRILRSQAGNNSALTGVRQTLNRDVSYFTTLVLKGDIRLHNATLGGGGYQSSEYPLILRLRYRDVNNNELEMIKGFYYQNDDENPTRNGEKIPRDKWVPFQTGNLLQGLDPKPFYLLFIQIYASGWDYESFISGIHLTAE